MAGDTTIQENAKAVLKRAKERRKEEEHVLNTYHKKALSNAEEAFKGLAQLETPTQEGEQQVLPKQVTAQLNKQFEALDTELTKIAKEKYALLPRKERLRLRVLRTGEPWWIGRTLWRNITPSVQGKLAKWFFPSVQAKLKAREAWIKACKQYFLEECIARETERQVELGLTLRKLQGEKSNLEPTAQKGEQHIQKFDALLEKVERLRTYQYLWLNRLQETQREQKGQELFEYDKLALTKTHKKLIREQVDPVLGEKEYRAAKERERKRVQKVLEKDEDIDEKFHLDYEEAELLSETLKEIRTPMEIQALLQEEKKTRTLEEQIFKKYYKEEKNNVEAAFKGLSLAQTKQYSRRMDWEEAEIFIQSLVQPRLEQRFKALDAELTQIAKEKYATLPENEQIHLKFLRTRKLAWAFGWLKHIWPSPEWKIVQRLYPSLKGKLKKREWWIKDCKQHLLKDYIEKERGKWKAQKWETKKATLKAEKEKLEAIQNTWRSKRPWRWTRYSYSWIVKKRIQKLDALLEKIEKLHEYNHNWIIHTAEKYAAESAELTDRTNEGEEAQLSETAYKDLQMTETQKKLIRKEGDRRVGEVQDRVDSMRKQQKRRGIYTEVEDEITPEGGVVQDTKETRKPADFDEFVIMIPEQPAAVTKMLRKTATKRYEQRFGKVSLAHKIRARNPWAKRLKNVLRTKAMLKKQTVAALVPVLAEQERDRSEAKETQLDNLSTALAEAEDLLRIAYGSADEDGKADENITSGTDADIETKIEQLKSNEKAHAIVVAQSIGASTDGTRTLVSSRTASNFSIGTMAPKPKQGGGASRSRFKAISKIVPDFGKSKSRKKRKADSQPASSFGVSTGS